MQLFKRKRAYTPDCSRWKDIHFDFKEGVVDVSESKTFLYIHYLFVDPKYRRKGCGKRMLSRIIRYARKRKKAIILEAKPIENVSFTELVRFYKKSGFTMLPPESHCL